MSKKSNDRTSKENQELRRKIEALKAQLKYTDKEVSLREIASHENQGNQGNVQTNGKPPHTNSVYAGKTVAKNSLDKEGATAVTYNATYIKKDLLRTAILSSIVLVLIFGAYFSDWF